MSRRGWGGIYDRTSSTVVTVLLLVVGILVRAGMVVCMTPRTEWVNEWRLVAEAVS